MGNSATKEARPPAASRRDSISAHPLQADRSIAQPSSHDTTRSPAQPRSSRGRHEGLLGLVGASGSSSPEQRRETKPEREARKAAKERERRLRERERSLREESVDGGYLVTLGTYTGPEDFSKATVRQLMLERRVAPFWRGLNDHSDSWTEYQLVAAARGMPIPAPDEIPLELTITPVQSPTTPSGSKPIPINTDMGSAHGLSSLTPSQTQQSNSPASPLFRGRSKTLASLTSKNDSQAELTPQEVRLPHEPQINGQPVEAYLYKDVLECPICFLYYPRYLNRTRCCDQPICSECFVQIKRPDPHPPEHLDPNTPTPEDVQRAEQEGQLTSEPATCPFCVQSEFGVTYEPPPFRRGLAYAHSLYSKHASAIPSSLPSGSASERRRRGQSLSATAPGVITTDTVRPDWAKKLADARSQAARRSAAATALHTAAYQMGGDASRLGFGRRRRFLIYDPSASGSEGGEGRPIPNMEMLIAAIRDENASMRGRRSAPTEQSYNNMISGSSRVDEIEELMMMEAIRQSIAAEEERKRKEEKEAAKQARKEDKAKAKEVKKSERAADKAAKKGLYGSSSNSSSFFSSPLGANTPSASYEDPSSVEAVPGKGKARATPHSKESSNASLLGFNPLSEPTSTLNDHSLSASTSPTGQTSQSMPRGQSILQTAATGADSIAAPSATSQYGATSHTRRFSDTSSSISSVDNDDAGSRRSVGSGESASFHESSESPLAAASGSDPLVTFGSLAAMITHGDDQSSHDRTGDDADVDADAGAAVSTRGEDAGQTSSSLPTARFRRTEEEAGEDEIVATNLDTNGNTQPKINSGRYDHKEHGYFKVTEDRSSDGQVS